MFGWNKRIKELEMTVEELLTKSNIGSYDVNKPDLLPIIQKICGHEFKGHEKPAGCDRMFNIQYHVDKHWIKKCDICGKQYAISEIEYLKLKKGELVEEAKTIEQMIELLAERDNERV